MIKEKWMKRGQRVLANGRPGNITSIGHYTHLLITYVHRINVRMDGEKIPRRWHPADVQPIEKATTI